MDMPYHYARHAIRVILFPVLEEFGYVIPEEDLQQRLEKRYGECTKAMMISLFLSDDEAIKTLRYARNGSHWRLQWLWTNRSARHCARCLKSVHVKIPSVIYASTLARDPRP